MKRSLSSTTGSTEQCLAVTPPLQPQSGIIPSTADQSTTPKKHQNTVNDETWPVLVRIIPSTGSRPLDLDGQYLPARQVDNVRSQMLEGMFTPHRLIKLEPCLDPFSGNEYRELFLTTFPDFAAVHGARGAWDAADLEENPFMAMIIMEDVNEDKKISKLLQKPCEPTCPKSCDKPVAFVSYPPSDMFEQWWAAHDPEHWSCHQQNIEHQNQLRDNGVWLYKSEPGDPTYYSDPTTFSYNTPALVEYQLHDRLEEVDEAAELIDWYTTRMTGRISLHPHACFIPTASPVSAGVSSRSSDDEDRKKGGTPDTTPPDSPCLPYALVSYSDTESMRTDEPVTFNLSTVCEKQVDNSGSRKQCFSSSDSTVMTTTASEGHDYVTLLPLPNVPLQNSKSIITPEMELLLARLPSYDDDEPLTTTALFATHLPSPTPDPDAPQVLSTSSYLLPLKIFAYRYPHFLLGSSEEAHVDRDDLASNWRPPQSIPRSFHTLELNGGIYDVQKICTGFQNDNDRIEFRTLGKYQPIQDSDQTCDDTHFSHSDYPGAYSQSIEVLKSDADDCVDPQDAWFAALNNDAAIEIGVKGKNPEHLVLDGVTCENPQEDGKSLAAPLANNEVEVEVMRDTSNCCARNKQISADLNSEEVTSSEFTMDKYSTKADAIEDHVSVPEATKLTPADEIVSTGTDDIKQIEDNTFGMVGEPMMLTINDTTDFWLKLLLLSFMDHFSLGMLSNSVRNPVLSIAFVLVLFLYKKKDESEDNVRLCKGCKDGSAGQRQANLDV